MNSVRELLEKRSAERPDEVFLEFGPQRVTYSQMDRRVNRAAAGLAAAGLGRGDRAALLVSNCPEFIYIWWGLFKLGAVMVPINLRLSASEAAYIIQHSKARAVVVGSQSLGLLPELRAETQRAIRLAPPAAAPHMGPHVGVAPSYHGLEPLPREPLQSEESANDG